MFRKKTTFCCECTNYDKAKRLKMGWNKVENHKKLPLNLKISQLKSNLYLFYKINRKFVLSDSTN